jgi:hypothetical protein
MSYGVVKSQRVSMKKAGITTDLRGVAKFGQQSNGIRDGTEGAFNQGVMGSNPIGLTTKSNTSGLII